MKELKIHLEEPKLLSEDIAESIKSAIIKGKFRPGERISEGDLADSMGISRTPLREAFRKLENEGFITIIPRKGAVVTPIDGREILNLYEIKSVLEGLAARLAVPHLREKDLDRLEKLNQELEALIRTDEMEGFYRVHTRFHETFVTACGNPRLIQMIANLNDHFRRFGTVTLTPPSHYPDTIRQHGLVIAALRRGDAEAAEDLVRENVMTGGRVLLGHLRPGHPPEKA